MEENKSQGDDAPKEQQQIFDYNSKTPEEIGDHMMGQENFDKKETIAMLNNMILHSEDYKDKCQCWKDVKEHIVNQTSE